MGPYSQTLARSGATGYFGSITKNALSEYQQVTKIIPSSGYFGPVTKANILSALNPNSTSTGQVAEMSEEIIPEAEIPYSLVVKINKDLEIGSSGEEVVWLQDFLISADTGLYAKRLASVGATGYFGAITKDTLAEYQIAVGIKPASGYFGPITRTSIRTLGGN
jgi:peptidoglycan hydrolase-like protein with peptidoglycan-binding domain